MGEPGAPLLELSNVSKWFDETQAIADLDLEIREGEIFTLLGPSGCGKSTTLRMIAGLENPDQGTIAFKGGIIVDAETRRFTPPEKRNMGMVFQAYAVWPHMTVYDNVGFPLRVRRESRGETRTKVMGALDLVGLASRAGDYPWQLSGGQQQRVALARALVYSPDVLLLDEPLSNLDAKLREQMRIELRALQRQLGSTFVFVTHDQDEAMILSTRIAVMSHGRVEQIGTPAEVYERPATPFVRDFLGQSVLLSGRVRHDDAMPWIDLELGASVRLPNGGAGLTAGERVSLACRSESITLEPGEDCAEDQISAVIEDAAYSGDRIEYTVRSGETVLTVRSYAAERYPAGTRVSLGFNENGVTVWPDAG